MPDLHPARPDDAGDGLAVDTAVTVEGRRVEPGTWETVAEWCAGTRVLEPRGIALGSLAPEDIAVFGDWVIRTAAGFEVSRADGHYQRWQPAS